MCARSCVLVVHIRICLLSRLICIFIQHDDDDDGCLFISAYFLMSVLESASSRVTMTRMSCGMLDVYINVCVCAHWNSELHQPDRQTNITKEEKKKQFCIPSIQLEIGKQCTAYPMWSAFVCYFLHLPCSCFCTSLACRHRDRSTKKKKQNNKWIRVRAAKSYSRTLTHHSMA